MVATFNQSVTFSVSPEEAGPTGALIAAAVITGLNDDATVDARGFVSRLLKPILRESLTFQDTPPSDNSDLTLCWPS